MQGTMPYCILVIVFIYASAPTIGTFWKSVKFTVSTDVHHRCHCNESYAQLPILGSGHESLPW